MKTGRTIRAEAGREPARPRAQRPGRRRFVPVMPKDYISADQLRTELQQRIAAPEDRRVEAPTHIDTPEKWWTNL